MKLPKGSEKYILYQRTGYLKDNFLFNSISRLGNIDFLYPFSVNLKVNLFSQKIKQEYVKDMKLEFENIKKFLPKNCKNVLDIGCGLALVNYFISKNYSNKIDIYLLDKTKVDSKVYYNFKDRGSFYNSLSLSKKLLSINGINSKKIHIQEATNDNKIQFNSKFDLVISLISWGFHYPVSTYLDEVYSKLNKGGYLIIDVRNGSDGLDLINKSFKEVKIIKTFEKHKRILAIK